MLVFIGFTTPMAMLVRKILPDKPPAISTRATPQYLDEMFQQTPDIALERVRLELLHLGGLVQPMVRKAVPAALGGTREDLKQLADWDDDVDTLYDSIYEYIGGLSQYEMSEEQTHRLTELMEVLNSIESLGDIVEANIVPLGIRRLNQHIKVSPDAVPLFQPLVDQVCINVADALTALEKRDIELANRVIGHKLSVNALADNTFTHLSDSLTGDDRTRVQGIRIEIDLIEMLRRSYYFAKRIAKAVVEMEEGEDAEEAAQPTDEIQESSTH
jgi:phosphate:Na+ symporter